MDTDDAIPLPILYSTLQKIREYLALLLLVLLPLHAFLVTVGTRIILGADHAPLSVLAVWKELLLIVILIIAFFELCTALWKGKKTLTIDALDLCILALLVLAIVVSVFQRPFNMGQFALGFKYDLIPLISFVILRRVSWSEWFKTTAVRAIVAVATFVCAYGILTFFLPQSFFHWLGYSDAHSLYIADKPLASFQQIGETSLRRIQSTFSGPNQLGLWLLLPWSIGLLGIATLLDTDVHWFRALFSKKQGNPWWIGFALLVAIALLMSFSRSAWIGAFVITIVTLWWALPRKIFLRLSGGVLALVVVIGVVATLVAPKVFFRLSSTRGHLEHPIAAWNRMWDHPFGVGLGTAGPASNRGTDTCVFLRPQDDPSWAKSSPNLCVFLGNTQVQPKDPCNCPYLPENWYLQVGVETGVVGFVLFAMLTVLVICAGMRKKILEAPALAFLGISIACLLLHAWEDAAIAYSLWVLLAIVLSQKNPSTRK